MKSQRIVARIDRTLPSFIALSARSQAPMTVRRDLSMPISSEIPIAGPRGRKQQRRGVKLDARKRERRRRTSRGVSSLARYRSAALIISRLLGSLTQLTTRVLMRASGSEFVTRARVVLRKRPFIAVARGFPRNGRDSLIDLMDDRVVSGYLITRTLINPGATCALSPASARTRAYTCKRALSRAPRETRSLARAGHRFSPADRSLPCVRQRVRR